MLGAKPFHTKGPHDVATTLAEMCPMSETVPGRGEPFLRERGLPAASRRNHACRARSRLRALRWMTAAAARGVAEALARTPAAADAVAHATTWAEEARLEQVAQAAAPATEAPQTSATAGAAGGAAGAASTSRELS